MALPPVSNATSAASACDVALLGTGLAPLLAAAYLVTRGKTVLLLNPQRDFFLENSELSVDPLNRFDINAFLRTSPDRALESLRPHFPGAVESWSGPQTRPAGGFHDALAPHIRQRARLVIGTEKFSLEDLYLQASEAELNPQLWEGMQATKRLPGASHQRSVAIDGMKGLYLPRSCDFDVTRYRSGILEFVRERVPASNLVSDASQIELLPGGARFHSQGLVRSELFREGMIVFWTPALTQWVHAQAKELEVKPLVPDGVRLWEQWSLDSREKPDPSVIGMLDGLAFWAEVDGSPDHPTQLGSAPNLLSVLRRGPLVPLEEFQSPSIGQSWASQESFQDLSRLCIDYLGWQEISIRKLTPRAILEWPLKGNETIPASWKLEGRLRGSQPGTGAITSVIVQGGCDGPLVEVVGAARSACEALLGQGGLE